MQTLLKYAILLVFTLGVAAVPAVKADPPSGPPPLPGEHGGGNQGPSGAPIDGGLGILVVLGTAFAGIKVLKEKRSSGR